MLGVKVWNKGIEQYLEIIDNNRKKFNSAIEKKRDGLDFSAFKVDSFKEINGLKYQRNIRDE